MYLLMHPRVKKFKKVLLNWAFRICLLSWTSLNNSYLTASMAMRLPCQSLPLTGLYKSIHMCRTLYSKCCVNVTDCLSSFAPDVLTASCHFLLELLHFLSRLQFKTSCEYGYGTGDVLHKMKGILTQTVKYRELDLTFRHSHEITQYAQITGDTTLQCVNMYTLSLNQSLSQWTSLQRHQKLSLTESLSQ